MSAKVFFDTNVLVYLFDADAPAKQARAREVFEAEGRAGSIVLSTQVLQEFYVAVTRKLGKPLADSAAEAVCRDLSRLDVVETASEGVLRSIALARRNRLSLWDALILDAAQSRSCRRLLSEDLQHGREFGSLRVEDPFR